MALSPGALDAADVAIAIAPAVARRTLPRGVRLVGEATPAGAPRSDSDAPPAAAAPAAPEASAGAEPASASPSEPSVSAARTSDPAREKSADEHEGATTGGATAKTSGGQDARREKIGKRTVLWLALAALTIGAVATLRLQPGEAPSRDGSSVPAEEPPRSTVAAATNSAEPSPSIVVAPSPTGHIESPVATADSASPPAKVTPSAAAAVNRLPAGKSLRAPAPAPSTSTKRPLYTQD